MDPSDRDRRRRSRRDSSAQPDDERRRRRGHRATDSQGDLLPRAPRRSRRQSESEWEQDDESPAPRRSSPSPRKSRQSRGVSTPSSGRSRGSAPLSLEAIAKLDKANAKGAGLRGYDYDEQYLKEVRDKEKKLEKERVKEEREAKRRERLVQDEAAVAEAARRRREERRKEREKRGGGVTTDDERGHRRGVSDAEGDRRRSRGAPDADERRRRMEERYTASEIAEKKERRRQERAQRQEQKKRRVVSGPLAEEGGVADDDEEYQYMMEKRGGAGAPSQYTEEELAQKKKKKKRILIAIASVILLLAIIIPVAIVASKKGGDKDGGGSSDSAAAGMSKPSNSNLDGKDPDSVPDGDKGGILDPWSWWDTADFNVTYTNEKVGGLPIIGLNSSWDDDIQANEKVANLKDDFGYGKNPIRGVNVGGWLNLEPFITPSFFDAYSSRDGIIDEWTLIQKLGGPSAAKEKLERHYSTFITRQTFVDIRNAGFDHVRIPFGYWMVETYPGDQYVSQVSWRYLLRGIEYARQNGLRVNLDMHGAPGSQNGWNHSGRQGVIGWLNGTDGTTNGNRWLSVHHQLATFFAQDRYKHIVTMYGLVNEPRMVDLNTDDVLSWSAKAIEQIRKDGIEGIIVFGDGFLGLDKWQGRLQDHKDLLLDVHQYAIFNLDQLQLDHRDKLNFACKAWTQQSRRSMTKSTGFGPTMCGEWSQADTDCTQYLNNVGIGTRWEGTLDTGNASTSVLEPFCPLKSRACSCTQANAAPGDYSDAYKKWLLQFALAQMISFEEGWGWFYWTWKTEKATQWSYEKGMAAGILPAKAWDRKGFECGDGPEDLEDFGKMGLSEAY